MSDDTLIKSWNGKPATFVEATRDGTIVVTVENDRREMSQSEWDRLAPHDGKPPDNFNKPALG